MVNKLFGEFFKKKRIEIGMTLRQFCLDNNLDPGNMSKIERGILTPPQTKEKLEHYAKCLCIKEGSDDWLEFFDRAHASSGRIPEEILSDAETVAKLPLVFRTLRGQKLNKEQLDKLVEELNKI